MWKLQKTEGDGKKNRDHARTYRRKNIQKHLFAVLNFFMFHSVMKVWEQLSTKNILLTANLTPQTEVFLIYFAPIRKRKVVCEVRYGTIKVRKRYRKNNVILYRTVLGVKYRTVISYRTFSPKFSVPYCQPCSDPNNYNSWWVSPIISDTAECRRLF